MFKNKLTIDDILAVIDRKDFYVFPGTTLTVCCITLKDGFAVIGQDACLDAVNFDPEIGRSEAEKNAINNIWQVEGYLQNYKNKQGSGALESAVIADLRSRLASAQAEVIHIAEQAAAVAQAQAVAAAAAVAAGADELAKFKQTIADQAAADAAADTSAPAADLGLPTIVAPADASDPIPGSVNESVVNGDPIAPTGEPNLVITPEVQAQITAGDNAASGAVAGAVATGTAVVDVNASSVASVGTCSAP